MNTDVFVQNIKKYCELRGVKPTVACRDSGAGKSLISQIETRGVIPSVEKVQLLAGYLGVTTSELLGEPVRPASAPPDPLLEFYHLSPAEQQEVLSFIHFKAQQKKGGD